MNRIKTLLFDVFGTLVDWRTALAREVHAMAARHGKTVDALAFADAWRAQYQPSMEAIRGWVAALEQGLARNERTAIYNLLRDAVPEFRGEAA